MCRIKVPLTWCVKHDEYRWIFRKMVSKVTRIKMIHKIIFGSPSCYRFLNFFTSLSAKKKICFIKSIIKNDYCVLVIRKWCHPKFLANWKVYAVKSPFLSLDRHSTSSAFLSLGRHVTLSLFLSLDRHVTSSPILYLGRHATSSPFISLGRHATLSPFLSLGRHATSSSFLSQSRHFFPIPL